MSRDAEGTASGRTAGLDGCSAVPVVRGVPNPTALCCRLHADIAGVRSARMHADAAQHEQRLSTNAWSHALSALEAFGLIAENGAWDRLKALGRAPREGSLRVAHVSSSASDVVRPTHCG